MLLLKAVLAPAMVLSLPFIASAQAAFEVASIRPSEPRTAATYKYTPTGLFYTGATLGDCILAAYQITGSELSAPKWIRDQKFDITARASRPSTKLELMQMLQALLTERFGLTVHREPRVMKALVVTARKDALKLTRGDQEGLPDMNGPLTEVVLTNQSFGDLAHSLGRIRPVGAPVVDGTGIEGRYNFVLDLGRIAEGSKKPAAEVTKDAAPSLPPDPVSVLNGALRPYGLALQSRTAPVQVLVVDRADQTPTAN
jgi:uncharacterized protein (TIGR03435 family)